MQRTRVKRTASFSRALFQMVWCSFVRLARQLFGAAVEPKEAHFVPGGAHADLYDFGIDRVILEFLNRRFAG